MFFSKGTLINVPVCSLLLASLVSAMPKETALPYRSLLDVIKRQDDLANSDPEPYADTDYLRDAVPYRNNYLRDNRALTSMSVGAQPSDATMTVFTTLSLGESVPKPVDTNQGSQFEIDHLLEMQNIHGAFSVMNKPNGIPQADWDAVKRDVFSNPGNGGNAQMTRIASQISGPPNMEGIPAAINNFKGQVFKGVINGGKGAPSTTRYPTEFGPTVNKLLSDRKPSYDEVITNLCNELQGAGNNNTAVSSYFNSYASSVYSSATSFLSQWTGKTGVYASTSTSTTSSATGAAVTTTTNPPDSSTSTSSESPASTSTGKCKAGTMDASSCDTLCVGGKCTTGATALGQQVTTCSDCP